MQDEEVELPLLPDVAFQILNICNSPDGDPTQITKILHRDQGLAGNVLRIANSPFCGSKVKIVSLQQAVSRLGMRQISEIAMAVSLQGQVFKIKGRESLVERLWDHSIKVAVCCKEISRYRKCNVENDFLSGLLHDIGKPVLLQMLFGLEEKIDRSFDDSVVELALDEFHTGMGFTLTDRWQLPDWICDAVAHHHDWEKASDMGAETAMTIHLGNVLMHHASLEDGEADEEELRKDPVLEGLNLYPEDVDELLQKLDHVIMVAEAMS